ncbi:MAG: hypothetical protein ACE5IH_07970 [Thermodesulfobacteriota bacterium]
MIKNYRRGRKYNKKLRELDKLSKTVRGLMWKIGYSGKSNSQIEAEIQEMVSKITKVTHELRQKTVPAFVELCSAERCIRKHIRRLENILGELGVEA